jgi:hypothetical protein
VHYDVTSLYPLAQLTKGFLGGSLTTTLYNQNIHNIKLSYLNLISQRIWIHCRNLKGYPNIRKTYVTANTFTDVYQQIQQRYQNNVQARETYAAVHCIVNIHASYFNDSTMHYVISVLLDF